MNLEQLTAGMPELPKSGLTFASLTVTSSATFGLSAGANPTNEPICRFDSIFPFL